MFKSTNDAKQAAKVLREYLKANPGQVPGQSETLHLLAQMLGLKNWQTLKAQIEDVVPEQAPSVAYPIQDLAPRGVSSEMVTIDGHRVITGTLETVPGEAFLARATRTPEGTLDLEYEGETQVSWDAQRSVYREGQKVFVDEDGNEYLESQVMLVPVGWEPDEDIQD